MRRSCWDDTRNCRRENTLATITLNIAKANRGAKVKGEINLWTHQADEDDENHQRNQHRGAGEQGDGSGR